MSECRKWYEGDPILEEYHDHEWCKINHDDDFQFEMLCLEGASVGLSWQIIKTMGTGSVVLRADKYRKK